MEYPFCGEDMADKKPPTNGESKKQKKPVVVVHIGEFKLKNSKNRKAVFVDLARAIGFPVRMIYIQKDTKTSNKFNLAAVLSHEEGLIFQEIQANKKEKTLKVPTEDDLKKYGSGKK